MRTEDGSRESYAQVTNTMASLAGVAVNVGVYICKNVFYPTGVRFIEGKQSTYSEPYTGW
jgi:hypothetical protein